MKKQKTFRKVFDEVKQVAVDNNLSIDEFAENTGVDPQLLRILFNDSTDVINGISRIFGFVKIDLKPRKMLFKPYKVTTHRVRATITRLVSPKCYMHYSLTKGGYSKFTYDKNEFDQSETTKELIKAEMKDFMEKELSKSRIRTFKQAKENKLK